MHALAVDEMDRLWQAALPVLRSLLRRPPLRQWLQGIRPVELRGGILRVAVPSSLACKWLVEHALAPVGEALQEAAGRPIGVEFLQPQLKIPLDDSHRQEPQPPAAPGPNGDNAIESIPLNPRYTFERFVVGQDNRFAHAAAHAVATSPGKSYNPLFLYGGVGLGKTHLLQAIGHFVHQHSSRTKLIHVSSDTFTYHVVSSIREDRFGTFRAKYREVDLWLVDDIQFIASRERTQAEFFHTFNALHETGRQIVITSDRPPKELQVMDARLSSRFEWGLSVDLRPPDLETRIAILERKIAEEQVYVPQDVLRYIASAAASNVRILEGALVKVLAAARLTGFEITLTLAREQLKDHSLSDLMRPLSIIEIQELVADHFHLDVARLKGPSRERDVVFARHIAMYLCRTLMRSSFPQIGKEFGGKDHSTVIHACTKLTNQIEQDPQVRALVNEITNRAHTIA